MTRARLAAMMMTCVLGSVAAAHHCIAVYVQLSGMATAAPTAHLLGPGVPAAARSGVSGARPAEAWVCVAIASAVFIGTAIALQRDSDHRLAAGGHRDGCGRPALPPR